MTALQEARDLIAKCFAEYKEEIPQMEICRGFSLLPLLVSEIETWQAMAIRERANRNYVQSFIREHKEIPKDRVAGWTEQAASELALDAPAWKKIGPEETDAIQQAIDVMLQYDWEEGEADYRKEIAVLRKLLECDA
jgi:hypothetical protein